MQLLSAWNDGQHGPPALLILVFMLFVALFIGPPSFSMLHAEKIASLRPPSFLMLHVERVSVCKLGLPGDKAMILLLVFLSVGEALRSFCVT